jgi:murein DD-endopeptidase MepM/ murein hydrolase activator NlpD
MREQNERRSRSSVEVKDKQAWVGLASACVAVALSVVLIVAFASGQEPSIDAGKVDSTPLESAPLEDVGGGSQEPAEEDVGMGLPMEIVAVANEFGFYHNSTINSYYEHSGMDFSAEVGASVLATEDGVVESIYSGDVLKGTEIVLDHGDGVKSVYRFVVAVDGLKVGDSVEQGEKIATVAEPSGDEYKDGAHLHFEILVGGASVDPSGYLPFEEK